MSLYKRPDSRIWWAAIRLPDGSRVCRSSGTAKRRNGSIDCARISGASIASANGQATPGSKP
jgi:hypothetical protein